MKRKKLPVWSVRWHSDYCMWFLYSEIGDNLQWNDCKPCVVRWAGKLAKRQSHPVSLRIFLKNGRIQEERTYPRSADPRRSKG